ncbi:McrC family protein [Castellaniella hirudinis]|uniref:McrC family protein n=1 Tax=Castellaniella hirudinis TaxID=1144617 RepID=UPI0039C118D1
MKRLLRCEEWSKLRVGPGLELESLEELSSIVTAWKHSTGEQPDAYFNILPNALVPRFWTGTLETALLILEVAPIGANLLGPEARSRLDTSLSAMLATAMSAQSMAAGLAPLSSDGSRHEILLEVFCNELQLARRRQVIRRYISISDNLPAPRGRISFPSQCYESIRRPGRFASTWVALTEDVPENRIFKKVLLHYQPRSSAWIRGRIDLCLSELDSVDASGDHRLEWAKVRADRLPPIYHSLLQQSKALLDEEGAGVFAGERLATSEIIFTSRLFEQFIAKELAWISPSTGLVSKAQGRGTFACSHGDGKGIFELVPDIRLIDKYGKTALIVDTKWKSLDMRKRQLGISREDVYQVLTYGSRFNCLDIVLMYPDVTNETGKTGYYQKLESVLGGRQYSIHIVKVPLLASTLIVVRDLLKKLLKEKGLPITNHTAQIPALIT